MSIETALRALLLADAGVSPLVSGERVYPGILPQAVIYPAVTYQIIAGGSHYAMDGPSNLADPRVQLDCYAEAYDEVLELKGAVIKALGGYRGEVSGVMIYGAFKAMERDEYEDALEKTGSRLWRKTLDFNIWFRETFA